MNDTLHALQWSAIKSCLHAGLKNRIPGPAIALGLVFAIPVTAETRQLDETTILATGFAMGKNDTGLQVTVQNGEDLNDTGIWRLEDAVLLSPGVHVFSAGADGAASSLFTRGTESDHTAIYVDGIKFSDSRIFPFPAANILSGAGVTPGERIELLRGPQSALYGSDAIGGVLSLSLEQGDTREKNKAWLELGSFESVNSGVSFRGQEGNLSYNTFASWNQTSNDRDWNDYESTQSGIRLDYALSNDTTLGLTLRVLRFETELPPLGTTAFAINETENTIYSVFIEHQLGDDFFTKLIIGGYESEFNNLGGSGDSRVDSRFRSIDWSSRYQWSESQQTSAGITVTWLETENTGIGVDTFSEQHESIYLQHQWQPNENWDLLGGFRYDHYEDGAEKNTFRFAGSHQVLSRARLHGSVASGFKRPSVVDLFGFFGFGANPNLKPEESLGWDAGITFDLSETSELDITYFHNDIDELITFGPPPEFAAENIEEARTRGIEVAYQASFQDGRIQARMAYTWLEAENMTTGSRLLRRPSHSLNADIHARLTSKLILGAGVTWVADREDYEFFDIVDAEDYTTARIYGRYQLNDSVSMHARVENLFDEQYAEIPNFPARGMGVFAGVTVEW